MEQSNAELRRHVITSTAELTASRETLQFTLRALQVVLAATGTLGPQMAEALQKSLKQHRGERLSLGVIEGLAGDDATAANAAYRQAIAAQAAEIEAVLQEAQKP